MRTAIICGAAFLLSGSSFALRADAPKLPDGPGKATTEKVCGTCHGAELVIGRQESREAWSGVVNEMIQRGAKGTDDEFYEVVEYLSTHFSKSSPVAKLNVNKATAKDLENTLNIPTAQAVAIVQHRDEKGEFKSIEDLEKVPGVDAAKIEANKGRLSFSDTGA